MIRNREIARSAAGWTLVELMVVTVVITIVASLAFMQRGTTNEQFQRQNAARELKVAFERARFDSVKRRATAPVGFEPDLRAYVIVTSNSFTLRTDNNQNGVLDAADDLTYTFPAGVIAEGYGFSLGGSFQVFFNQRGESSVASDNPQFMICNVACPSPPGAPAVSNTVLVTPTGTVNLLGGGVSIPTFLNPTGQTTVGTSEGIKSEAVLP